jgi:hypothetical protein
MKEEAGGLKSKVSRSAVDLEIALNEQLKILKRDVNGFDGGEDFLAKDIALRIRVLLHHSKSSKALLYQLGLLEEKEFYDTALAPFTQENKIGFHGLICFGDSIKGAVPFLDDAPNSKLVKFEAWWNQPVFWSSENKSMTRKDLVLTMANQDGGAHFDPSVNEAYHKLSTGESFGLKEMKNDKYIERLERVAIRQIGHEVLKSLVPGYSKAQASSPGTTVLMAGMEFSESVESPVLMPVAISNKKITGRNDPCPCGKINNNTGKNIKYKYCHGK